MTGHQLAKRRKTCGWTQYQLAALMGINRARLAAYEQGQARVPERVADAIQAAADVLGPAKVRVERIVSTVFTDEPLKARHTRWD